MKEREQKMAQQYKKESDDILFAHVEFDDRMKHQVKERLAVSEQRAGNKRKSWLSRSKWAYGTAAAALLLVLAVSVPQLGGIVGQPDTPHASEAGDGGSPGITPPVGTDLSQLKTAVLGTPEEAKERFGDDLLVPTVLPERFALGEIEAAGMEEQTKTRVVFFYRAADSDFTYSADRAAVTFPAEMFEPIEVNGAAGHIFAQPGMTELYWTQDGVHYGIVGMLTQEEAVDVAASLQ